jgi:hypothetical protein
MVRYQYAGGKPPMTRQPLGKTELKFVVAGDTDCYGDQEYGWMVMTYDEVVNELEKMKDDYDKIDKTKIILSWDEHETISLYNDYTDKVDNAWWKYMSGLFGIVMCSTKLKIILNRIRKRNAKAK